METDMSYIYEVYRTGSFSQAARNLFMTQPALSIAVKRVEEAVGASLFERSTQPLALTEAGKIYIRRLKEIQFLEEEMDRELKDYLNAEEGELTIGGSQYFNAYILPPVIHHYNRNHPGIRLHIREANSTIIDQWMEDRRLDIGFHSAGIDTHKFHSKAIAQDEILLAIPKPLVPQNAMTAGLTAQQVAAGIIHEPECPQADITLFSELPFLILSESNQFRQRTLAICQEKNLQPSVRFCIEQLETSWHFARQGLGAAFITNLMIARAMDESLLYYKLNSPLAQRTFHALTRKQAFLSRSMKEFIGAFA